MFNAAARYTFSLLAVAFAQQPGTLTAETHPKLTTSTCTAGGSCTTNQNSVVLDANWRWTHSTSSATNCYTGKRRFHEACEQYAHWVEQVTPGTLRSAPMM